MKWKLALLCNSYYEGMYLCNCILQKCTKTNKIDLNHLKTITYICYIHAHLWTTDSILIRLCPVAVIPMFTKNSWIFCGHSEALCVISKKYVRQRCKHQTLCNHLENYFDAFFPVCTIWQEVIWIYMLHAESLKTKNALQQAQLETFSPFRYNLF